MNSKNALGFLVLGLLMHSAPLVAQWLADASVVVGDASVRTVWLEFMSWVNGGIGVSYFAREGVLHVPALISAIVPEQWLRPVAADGEPVQISSPVRVGVSG
jgi:hypothetical protein